MKGTEKQVAWAEKIRSDYHIGVARLRALRKRVPAEFAPEIDERLRKLASLEKRLGDDAVAWIEKGRSSTAYAIGRTEKWREMWAPLLKGKISTEFQSWLVMSLDWETPITPVIVDASRKGLAGFPRARDLASDAVEGVLPHNSPSRLLVACRNGAGYSRQNAPLVVILPDDVAENERVRETFAGEGVKIIAEGRCTMTKVVR
jgi:hypothetical protein